MSDLVIEVLRRFGVLAVIAGVSLGVGIWTCTHIIAEPGTEVSVLFGLAEYRKSGPKGVESDGHAPGRSTPSETMDRRAETSLEEERSQRIAVQRELNAMQATVDALDCPQALLLGKIVTVNHPPGDLDRARRVAERLDAAGAQTVIRQVICNGELLAEGRLTYRDGGLAKKALATKELLREEIPLDLVQANHGQIWVIDLSVQTQVCANRQPTGIPASE